VRAEAILNRRREICREILESLPEWFGIPESITEYADAAEKLDMLGIIINDVTAGFVLLRNTSDVATDVYVIAIRPDMHRRGLGSALVHAASDWACSAGRKYLTVKTLGPSRSNTAYERTRRFYLAMGFEPIEEFEGLWEENPCLFMLKAL
jgi:GNAT superfamily N-acetyltransferase